jgi:hypothetical protein
VKASTCSTGKLLYSLPRNVVVELCCDLFIVAYCHEPEGKLQKPLPYIYMKKYM